MLGSSLAVLELFLCAFVFSLYTHMHWHTAPTSHTHVRTHTHTHVRTHTHTNTHVHTHTHTHRDEAEMEYLKLAQDLDMYGITYFDIKVCRGLVWGWGWGGGVRLAVVWCNGPCEQQGRHTYCTHTYVRVLCAMHYTYVLHVCVCVEKWGDSVTMCTCTPSVHTYIAHSLFYMWIVILATGLGIEIFTSQKLGIYVESHAMYLI